MKKILLFSLLSLFVFSVNVNAQKTTYTAVSYGKTLNLGIGVGGYAGYFGYIGRSLPVFHLNYEFDVARNFTLAPFISFSSYTNSYYWGDHNHPYKTYYYHETVIPIGLKGTYYLDQLFKANGNWDFYLGGSLGFAIVNAKWDTDYDGDVNYYQSGSPLFFDFHLGTEYHFNNRIGAFLDLSTGVSTIGIAIH